VCDQSQQGRPVYNLSQRVLSLAQAIDMLPAGDYTIQLTKPDLSALSWHAEIVRVERVREMELPKRQIRQE
jgi:hypothetical protein